MLPGLEKVGQKVDLSTGTAFIKEGESLDRLFIVLDGEAEVMVDVEGVSTRVGPLDEEKSWAK